MTGHGPPAHRRRPTSPRGGGPVRLSESLQAVSHSIGMAGPDVLGVIFGHWEEIVGPGVSVHVRPQRLQGDTLVVVADHPAWAAQVRHLAADILASVRRACGTDEAPTRLDVRVRA